MDKCVRKGDAPINSPKKHNPYDIDLSSLPPGQRRAMEALIGGSNSRTYTEAAKIAGMAEGTLLTHVNRVRQGRPEVYRLVRKVRKAQLKVRHRIAVNSAQAHSRDWWRRVNRCERVWLGFSPFG